MLRNQQVSGSSPRAGSNSQNPPHIKAVTRLRVTPCARDIWSSYDALAALKDIGGESRRLRVKRHTVGKPATVAAVASR